jgi:tripartite-type tricarboxylate transporter receptor subunit TctC
MRLSNLRVGAIAIAGALVVSACGGAGSTGSPAAPPASVPAATASAAGASPSSSGVWQPEYVGGVLQPLPDGFPSQPITLLVADEASSTDGIYARQYQSVLRDISPVAVEVLDRGEGADPNWEAVQWTLDQEGGDQGHYPLVFAIPALAVDPLVIDLEGQLGMGFDDLHLINVTEVSAQVMVSRVDAPWGDSFEALVQHVKDGNEVKIIKRLGTTGDLASRRIQLLQGITFTQIPGGSIDEDLAVVGAGEADITVTQAPAAFPHYEAGRIVPLMVAGDLKLGAPWESVPSMKEAGMAGEPWASNRGWLVSSKVPELHSQWLAELFRAGHETAAFQEGRGAIPGVIQFDPPLDHAGAQEMADRATELAEPLIRDLGLHWDQQ